ncbi:MAG TPA: ATP-binding protein [Candidatus Cryptobacteroides merdipullorum]|uniref:ATP-binding protein n=1 Tax=Candidatus Cryptobacteroides merdipullorum TaxID=2840771 RepID=A0A9D1GMG7_9BACT|nr:ATP-binding protein [Candidatus Cryptobacteroides merdipullorum]
MIARLIESKIRKALDRKKIVTVLGPRQAGKSTLAGVVAKAEADRILELNGDDSDVRTMFEDTDETRIRTLIGNHDFLLVDEAQKIINVGNMLKIIADRIPDMKVIATGSSSFKLAKAVNESLTGRKLEFRLYPLSFKEMVGHTNLLEERRLIAHRMIYGYYPEVVSSPGNEKEILKELIDSYLYKDVLEENSIGRPDRLVKLLQALAFQIGSTVSSNELAGLVGIDAKTVDRYINILERNFIIFTLPSYASNQRNELKFSRKLYFWDLGIRNAVIGNMAPLELRPPEEAGHLWENFLVSERIKRNDYAGRTFVKHYFWRTQQKKEVDLIEIEDGRMSAFEFKWKPGKAVAAPRQFTTQYNNAEFHCITPSEIGDFLL